MTRLLLTAAVAGMALATLTAWSFRGADLAHAAEPARPADSTAELVQASVRGCVEGLGLVEVGVSDQVAIVRCRPSLGVLPVGARP